MIYVDDLRDTVKTKNWKYKKSCHMVADTIEELHQFAVLIGMKIEWFQNSNWPHYDLTAKRREKAIRMGAREVTSKWIVRNLKHIKVNNA